MCSFRLYGSGQLEAAYFGLFQMSKLFIFIKKNGLEVALYKEKNTNKLVALRTTKYPSLKKTVKIHLLLPSCLSYSSFLYYLTVSVQLRALSKSFVSLLYHYHIIKEEII